MRARLVLLAAITAAVMLLIALVVARAQIATALADTDRQLAVEDIAPYVADLQRSGREHPDPPSSGVLIAVRAPDGSIVTDSMPDDVRERLGSSPFATVQTESAEFVVARRTVRTAAGTWTIWAARDTTAHAAQLAAIDLTLWLTGVALVLAFVVTAALFVRAALRPVDELRARAAALGPDELLPDPGGGDELARLAGTLNDLVTRTRAATAHERRMIADAAHELRTPVANLRVAAELARRDPAPERLDELVLLTSRLGDLAGNLLELARLDDGVRPEPSDARTLEDALLLAVDSWRTRLAGTDVELDHAVTVDDPSRRIAVDGVSIGRLADNLIANAVKAVGSRGSVRVLLEVGAHGLLLAVEDDGPGMPPALLDTAFDRFVRGSGSGGGGLGLALVQGIAQACGGSARLVPLPSGLRAEVRIPAV
ncbi:sensor histidine kinase [Amnibacterium kyonggiense]|uniref:sensor histidine kinase n=1 Tax=Amnibacterium kyonggiense TaxID=595671 RepID=UPI0013C2CB51|nr:HAMP domain-containing sensor histidine kinase [Amnibacterium kyonggiense]